MSSLCTHLPQIIQGGMGVGVSDWRLAQAVASRGQMGVVSGTALGAVLARRLQLGDPGGHLRRALDHFPQPEVAGRIWDAYYVPDGKPASAPFRLSPMDTWPLSQASSELLVVGNFVEVFLAKEGHSGPVGINYLQKIQLPTLPSLFGAILAGVDYVLMGGGIPLAIPGALDSLAAWQPASMPLQVEDNPAGLEATMRFDPCSLGIAPQPSLIRPKFLGIVASDIIAKTLARRSTGKVDGFIVEGPTAGGHNAPPRRDRSRTDAEPSFGPKDIPDVAKIVELGLPFWLAGGYGSPDKVQEALSLGACGVQVGTVFAYCDESAIQPQIKRRVLARYFEQGLIAETDFAASPTGYPFKLVHWSDEVERQLAERPRLCDLGYLREVCLDAEGKVSYRCPAEPVESYVRKGGAQSATVGRQCLCNGLVATIGLGQVRGEEIEPPILTSGEDFSFVPKLTDAEMLAYSAGDALRYLLA